MEKRWWSVIAGLLIIVAGIVLILQQFELITISGPAFGMLALFVGAVIFLALWLSNTKEWWPLIPGLIMLSWGVSDLLETLGLAGWIGALIGFAGSALPFLYIFTRNRRTNWWALIPGGVLGFIGVATVLGEIVGEEWTTTLILLGVALAFFAVFLVNRRNWWALIPAGVLTLVAMGVSPAGSFMQLIWGVLIFLAGVIMILYVVLRR